MLLPLYVDFYCYKYKYARWPFSTFVRVQVLRCVARAKATCCATNATHDHSSSPPHLWEALLSIKSNVIRFNEEDLDRLLQATRLKHLFLISFRTIVLCVTPGKLLQHTLGIHLVGNTIMIDEIMTIWDKKKSGSDQFSISILVLSMSFL